LLQASLSVRLNMIEPNNGQALSTTQDARPRYTGELLLRTRPKVYRQIVRLLSEGVSANQICKRCHVTRETVRAVERREAAEISARKKTIIAILSNVAELGAARMEETIGKAGLRDAAIGTGIAVDKMLALTGQTPSVNIANIVMPSEEEREERRAAHARLDEITRLLQERSAAREDGPVPSFSVGAELPGAPHRQLDEIARRLREAQSA
jgi:transcriptional regulator with XRE-family HTH domain